MKVWITKNVLTQGIRIVEARLTPDGDAHIERVPGCGFTYFIRAVDVHRTSAAAYMRAQKMRLDRMRSLRRQLERLDHMTIKEVK